MVVSFIGSQIKMGKPCNITTTNNTTTNANTNIKRAPVKKNKKEVGSKAENEKNRHRKANVDKSTVDKSKNTDDSKVINGVEVKIKKLPKKRGEEEQPQLVKIKRNVEYDKPIHLLISPYAAHCINNFTDGVEYFTKKTECKVIVYRTFCPRTRKDVIDSLPIDNKTYKNMLYAFDKSITLENTGNNKSYRSNYNSKTYKLLRNINIDNILTIDKSLVVGLLNIPSGY